MDVKSELLGKGRNGSYNSTEDSVSWQEKNAIYLNSLGNRQ